jgi:hypothetical protein
MRVRIPTLASLMVVGSVAFTVYGCYQDRPQHFVVEGSSLGVGSRANAYIIWHTEILEVNNTFSITAYVRDVPGATIRCTVDGFPSAGGTEVLTGKSTAGTRGIWWSFIKMDSAAWMGCFLHLCPPPKYTLDYSAPRSHDWTAASILALLTGPVFSAGYWLVTSMLRRIRAAAPGFEVLVAEPGTGSETGTANELRERTSRV